MAEQDFIISIRTTADTVGIKQTEAELKKLGVQVESIKQAGEGVGAGADLAKSLDVGVATAAVAGATTILRGIVKANEEQKKLNDELDKESEKLLRITQKWDEIASATRTEADIIRAIGSELPALEQGQRRLVELQRQQLTSSQAGVQAVAEVLNLYSRLVGLPPFLDANQYQKTLDQIKQGFADIIKLQEESASFAFQTQQGLKAQFDLDTTRDIQQVTDEIVRSNQNLFELQSQLNTETAEGLKLYRDYGLQIEQNESKIKALLDLEKQRTREAQETADEREKDVDFWQNQVQRAPPQVQRVLMNEAAARQAQAEGRERDAAMFGKSAEAFKRGMTPQQAEQLKTLEGAKDIVEAINRLADMWR